MVDAEVADALVDNVGAVRPVRLHKPALANVVAVANLQQLVGVVDGQRDLPLGNRKNLN